MAIRHWKKSSEAQKKFVIRAKTIHEDTKKEGFIFISFVRNWNMLSFPQITPSPHRDLPPACLDFPLSSPRRNLCFLSSVWRHPQRSRTWCPRCPPSTLCSWGQEECNDGSIVHGATYVPVLLCRMVWFKKATSPVGWQRVTTCKILLNSLQQTPKLQGTVWIFTQPPGRSSMQCWWKTVDLW